MFPKKIKFIRDDTEAKLEKEIIENKIPTGVYVYTKAKVFKGTELNLTLDRIKEMKFKMIIDY